MNDKNIRQILETKQKFISQFLKGSSYQKSVSDLEGNVLTYAEVKALALSQPLMKQLAEKENEIRNARILLMQEDKTLAKLEDELSDKREKLQDMESRLLSSRHTQSLVSTYTFSDYKQQYILKSKLITEDFLYHKTQSDNIKFLDFYISLPQPQDEKKPYIYLERFGEKHMVEMSLSPKGNVTRIVNFLKKFHCVVEEEAAMIERAKSRIVEIEKILGEKSPFKKRIEELEKERQEIMNLIAMSEKDVV